MQLDAEGAHLLASELKTLREKQGLTQTQIHEETRATIEQIELFEKEGYISVTASINSVYYRAFLRSYAQMVGVEEADVLAAAHAVQNGNYRGEIGEKYLGRSLKKAPVSSTASAPKATTRKPASDSPVAPAAKAESTPPASQSSSKKSSKQSSKQNPKSSSKPSATKRKEASGKSGTTAQQSAAPPPVPAPVAPPVSVSKTPAQQRPNIAVPLVLGVIVIAIIAGILWVRSASTDQGGGEDPTPPAPSDTTQVITPAPAFVLPDSFAVDIIPITPIRRLKVSTGPGGQESWHWLEAQETLTVYVSDYLRLRHDTETNGPTSQLVNIRLSIFDQVIQPVDSTRIYLFEVNRDNVCELVTCAP